jgi:hypothetical protein
MLYAEDGEVLGILEGVGKPGLAVKKFPKWTSIYSAAPNLPPALLRGIAQYAGLPVVNAFEGDVTYVNDRLVLVHTTVGGERHLNFSGKSGKVKEMISAKEFELENGYLTVNLKPRSTYIFLEERD